MRWEADKTCLYESCNDYATIEYKIVIEEKAGVEIKTKSIQWYQFYGVSATKQQILQH